MNNPTNWMTSCGSESLMGQATATGSKQGAWWKGYKYRLRRRSVRLDPILEIILPIAILLVWYAAIIWGVNHG